MTATGGPADRRQDAGVPGRVDAPGQPRHHHHARPGQTPPELRGHTEPVGGGTTGTDDRHPGTGVDEGRVPEGEENSGSLRVRCQRGGIAGPPQNADSDACPRASLAHRLEQRRRGLRLVPSVGVGAVSAPGERLPRALHLVAVDESAHPSGAGTESGDGGGEALVVSEVTEAPHDGTSWAWAPRASRR